MKENEPDDTELECITAATLYDWRVAHIELVQVHTRYILFVVGGFLHLVCQPGMLHALQTFTGHSKLINSLSRL